MSAPKYGILPASGAIGNPDQVPSALLIERAPNPRGRQDDHTTAFALIQEVLRQQTSFCSNLGDRIHVTPVFKALLEMAQQELRIYIEFMVSQKLLEKLKEVYEGIFSSLPVPSILTSSATSGNFPTASVIDTIIAEIAEKIKGIKPKDRDSELLEKFFALWSQRVSH